MTRQSHLKSRYMCRYASLNHNIYMAADTPADVKHAARACHCIVHPQCWQINWDTCELQRYFEHF